MNEQIEIILSISLASAFFILLAGKLGFLNFLQERAPKPISRLAGCDFCLSFWVSVVVCIVLFAASGNYSYLITPIFSTPITRALL